MNTTNKKYLKWLKIFNLLPSSQNEQNQKALSILSETWQNESNFITGVEKDTDSKKKFIKSPLNKHQESHRSPFSNNFYPSPILNYYISQRMQNYEKKINRALEEYTFLNYLNGISTVLGFENEANLTTVFFIKKNFLKGEKTRIGLVSGDYELRVSVLCEFRDQDKKNPCFSSTVESVCVWRIEVQEEQEKGSGGFGCSGTMTNTSRSYTNNFFLRDSIDCYDDLIPHLGRILMEVDNKTFLEIKRIIMPLRAAKIRENYNKKNFEKKSKILKNDIKKSIFDEIKAKEVDLSKCVLSNRRMKR